MPNETRDPAFERAMPITWRLAAAYCIVYSGVYLIPNTSPLLVGALVDHLALTEARAGLMLTLFMGSMCLASFALAPIISRFSYRWIAVLSIGFQLAGFAFGATGNDAPILLTALMVSGFGTGLLFAVVNAAIAGGPRPVFVYGLATIVASLVSAAAPIIMTAQIATDGTAGFFWMPLLLASLTLLSASSLPHGNMAGQAVEPVAEDRGSQLSVAQVAGLLIMLGSLVTGMFQMPFYSFAERLLARAGHGTYAIGLIFTAVMLTAALGGAIACLVGRHDRYRLSQLMLVTVALAATIFLAVVSTDHWVVAVAVILESPMAMLVVALQLGVAASLDRSGHWVAATGGALFLSWAVGPLFGGWLISSFGYASLIWTTLIGTAIALFIYLMMAAVRVREPDRQTILQADR